MRKIALVAVAAVAAASAGCGQSRAETGGPMVQRSYSLGAFRSIEVTGPYDVEVRTGGNPGASARGPQALIDRLVVEVKGDRLLIHPRQEHNILNWNSNRGSAKVEVSAAMLSAAAIAGSGGIAIDKISGDSFTGSVAGSGDLDLGSVAVQSLKLSVGGSGDIRAHAGQARSGDFSTAGSGDIDARGIGIETASAAIVGSGSITARATGTANVKITGSGDVNISGGASCRVSKMGSGDAHCS